MIYFASYFALCFALGALIGFLVGYIYRGPGGNQAAPAAVDAAPAPSAAPRVLDGELAALPGMNEALARKLTDAGVHDLDAMRQLGRSDERVDELVNALRLEDFTVRRWITLAGLLGIDGIDADLANALLRVGVRSPADLAGANADRVQNKLGALNEAESIPGTVPSRQQVVELIERAAGGA